MHDDPVLQSVVNTYRLVMPTNSVTQRSGELLGRATGSSLEFQEYREYLPGDDVRHLDWTAYARTDALMVRMHREEISPSLDVYLDTSRSMTTAASKAAVARQLAAALVIWSTQAGGTAAVQLFGNTDSTRRISGRELPELASVSFDGQDPLPECLAASRIESLRQALRVVLSDFLFDGDAAAVVRAAARTAANLWVIQLLSRFESDPQPVGGRRLVDTESGDESDVVLNPANIAAYKQRLAALQKELDESCRKVHARFLVLVTDEELPALCKSELCRAGLLEPA